MPGRGFRWSLRVELEGRHEVGRPSVDVVAPWEDSIGAMLGRVQQAA